METKFWPDIINDLKLLLETKSSQDVLIQAGREPNYLELYAHSLILCCRSQYFRNAFSINSFEKVDGKYIIQKPDITPGSFKNILCYLYVGRVSLNADDGIEVLNLLLASNEFGLHKLTQHVTDFLLQHQANFIRKHPIEMINMVFTHDLFINLQEFCLESISLEPDILLSKDQFKLLPEDVLVLLLKREDLSLQEISIWKNIVAWGLERNPSVDLDVNKWSKDDISSINSSIGKYVPFIQFHDISAEDFFNDVLPYEELLPRELRQDILKSYMLPGLKFSSTSVRSSASPTVQNGSYISNGSGSMVRRPVKLESEIITTEHILLFASWIDKKKTDRYKNIKAIPYEFNLLLRGSRDGMDPQSFHKLCDNKGPTLLVIRVKNSKRMVGGYNPLAWDSTDRSKSSSDSFIFSLSIFDDLNSATIGRVKSNECSVRCYKEWGAIFGNYANGNDLAMKRKAEWKSKPVSYENINLPKKFNCSDYEVFQVKKKK